MIKVFDDSSQSDLADTKALGLVDFVVLPHFGDDKHSDLHAQVIEEFKDKYHLIPLRDDEYIEVNQGTATKISV